MEEISLNQVTSYTDKIIEMAVEYGPKLLLAILTLIIGLWIIKAFIRALKRNMAKRELDASLTGFITSLSSTLLKVLLAISVAGMIGIEMTSFIAILGAAGLAIGLALSGTLQNFAGGVILLILKPYKVGDYIEAQGYAGSVKEIQIFHTVLLTPDNVTIIIPNSPISTGALKNYSAQERRRVDFTFGIGYDDDIDQAKSVLTRIIDADERIQKDPAPFIGVIEHADSSINLVVRVWANTSDYWGIYFDMMEKVKKEFDKESISIPFPQRDVHLFQEQA
jgi:small conductance mechanosensitive channel